MQALYSAKGRCGPTAIPDRLRSGNSCWSCHSLLAKSNCSGTILACFLQTAHVMQHPCSIFG